MHGAAAALNHGPVRLRLDGGRDIFAGKVMDGRALSHLPLRNLGGPGGVVLRRCHVHVVGVLAAGLDYAGLLPDDLLVAR